MKRLRSLSHPGVGLGVTALIVALSGTAIALPGKDRVTKNDIRARAVAKSEIRANAVGKSEIRANAVGKSEIRENAVGGSEIADGSVRGADVDEASLGKVPSAAQADSAATAANAGTVGGKTAGQLDTRWALIAENGTIERQTGGFTTVNCYQANANCYIDAGEDVRDNGISAQIAIANTDGSAILSAETGAAPCGATFVACAPPNTERNDVLVVAPRFYVFVTGSQG